MEDLTNEIEEKEQYLNKIKQELSNNKTSQEIARLNELVAYRDKQIEILKREVDEKSSQLKANPDLEKTIQSLKSENEILKKEVISEKEKLASKADNDKIIAELKKENESLKKEVSNKDNEIKTMNEKFTAKEGDKGKNVKKEESSKESGKDLNTELKKSLIEKDIELNNLKTEIENLKKVK